MIVTVDIFQGELSLGQSDYADVIELINLFIDKYEPVYLRKMLGVKLANELIQNYEGDVEDGIWKRLGDILKLPCANYIYYWIRRNEFTLSGGIGEVLPEGDNSTPASPASKQVLAWNNMVQLNREAFCKIDVKDYPGHDRLCRDWDIFRYINTFNI